MRIPMPAWKKFTIWFLVCPAPTLFCIMFVFGEFDNRYFSSVEARVIERSPGSVFKRAVFEFPDPWTAGDSFIACRGSFWEFQGGRKFKPRSEIEAIAFHTNPRRIWVPASLTSLLIINISVLLAASLLSKILALNHD